MIFNYFKKKKELKLKRIQAIKAEIQIIKNKCKLLADEDNKDSDRYRIQHNSKCPKCKSTNIIDTVKRIQGDIKGSISGGGSLLYSSIFGRIDGELDTNEVNKCKDCGNEWKKYNTSIFDYTTSDDKLKSQLRSLAYHLESWYQINNCEFDENDINEKYNSLEEKKAAMRSDISKYREESFSKFWAGISLDTLKELIKQGFGDDTYMANYWEKHYNKEILIKLGFKEQLEIN